MELGPGALPGGAVGTPELRGCLLLVLRLPRCLCRSSLCLRPWAELGVGLGVADAW